MQFYRAKIKIRSTRPNKKPKFPKRLRKIKNKNCNNLSKIYN